MDGNGTLLHVGVVGINFKTADLALRDRVARCTMGLTGEAALFFTHRTVVLSTCNRTEIYFSAPDLAAAQCDLLRFLRQGMSEAFEYRLYSYFGVDCFAHLCRVTAGLDSAILAETEIQAQVKQAYQEASLLFALPSELHFLFQKALKISKEVRSQLPLVRGASTLHGILWELMRRRELDWSYTRTLFIGRSQTNRELLFYLKSKGMVQADLCTRYDCREVGCRVYGRDILERWEEYDLIISASKSSKALLYPKACPVQPRLIFDLSVPRNVHPFVGAMPCVSLYNIEQLSELIKEREKIQEQQLHRAEAWIQKRVFSLSYSRLNSNRQCVKILHGLGSGGRG